MTETWTTAEIKAAFELPGLATVKVYPGRPEDLEPYHTVGTLLYQMRLRRENLRRAFGVEDTYG